MPYVYVTVFHLWPSMRALLINFKMNRASQDCPCTCKDLNESCVYAVAYMKVSSAHFVMCGAISVEYMGSIPVEN